MFLLLLLMACSAGGGGASGAVKRVELPTAFEAYVNNDIAVDLPSTYTFPSLENRVYMKPYLASGDADDELVALKFMENRVVSRTILILVNNLLNHNNKLKLEDGKLYFTFNDTVSPLIGEIESADSDRVVFTPAASLSSYLVDLNVLGGIDLQQMLDRSKLVLQLNNNETEFIIETDLSNYPIFLQMFSPKLLLISGEEKWKLSKLETGVKIVPQSTNTTNNTFDVSKFGQGAFYESSTRELTLIKSDGIVPGSPEETIIVQNILDPIIFNIIKDDAIALQNNDDDVVTAILEARTAFLPAASRFVRRAIDYFSPLIVKNRRTTNENFWAEIIASPSGPLHELNSGTHGTRDVFILGSFAAFKIYYPFTPPVESSISVPELKVEILEKSNGDFQIEMFIRPRKMGQDPNEIFSVISFDTVDPNDKKLDFHAPDNNGSNIVAIKYSAIYSPMPSVEVQ